jgi:hypothetical protein
VPFGGLINENFFSPGEYPFLKNFKRNFICKSKKLNDFSQVKDNRKIPKPNLYQIGVKESKGDFTSGLTRPIAVEIVFLPFSAIAEALITSKRYKMDGKCQQTQIENRGRSIDW